MTTKTYEKYALNVQAVEETSLKNTMVYINLNIYEQ